MVVESSMVCVNSSVYMWNGEFRPNQLQVQQDAVIIASQIAAEPQKCKPYYVPEMNVTK